VPRLRRFIALSTLLPAALPYFRRAPFFAATFPPRLGSLHDGIAGTQT
jgi:hypothetical protein